MQAFFVPSISHHRIDHLDIVNILKICPPVMEPGHLEFMVSITSNQPNPMLRKGLSLEIVECWSDGVLEYR